MLLYKNERQQYEKAIADNVSPSSVYGAEHLLRLFGMNIVNTLLSPLFVFINCVFLNNAVLKDLFHHIFVLVLISWLLFFWVASSCLFTTKLHE